MRPKFRLSHVYDDVIRVKLTKIVGMMAIRQINIMNKSQEVVEN